MPLTVHEMRLNVEEYLRLSRDCNVTIQLWRNIENKHFRYHYNVLLDHSPEFRNYVDALGTVSIPVLQEPES